jgi:hypothetical protein
MHGVVVPAFATSSSLLSTAQKALTLGDPQPWDLFQADMISSRQRLLVWEPCRPRLETRKCIKSPKLKLVWYIDNAGHPMLLACTNSGIALHRPNSRCCHCKTPNTRKEGAKPSQPIRGVVNRKGGTETIKSRRVRGNLCSSSNSSASLIHLPLAAASSSSLVSERGSVDDCLGLTKVKYRRGLFPWLILAMRLGGRRYDISRLYTPV